MTTGTGQVVCVTGASGYIGSWLVKFLLERGYTVNATVRDPNNPKKVDHLVKLDGAKERLHLFKADLLEEGSFDSAVQGSPTFKNITSGWIDVRDVANAHILAYENGAANGRYILAERVIHHSQAVQILRDLYPTLPLPNKCAEDKPHPPVFEVSKERAKSLGLEFTPLEVSLKDTVESLREKGFVKF